MYFVLASDTLLVCVFKVCTLDLVWSLFTYKMPLSRFSSAIGGNSWTMSFYSSLMLRLDWEIIDSLWALYKPILPEY
jgi:hypothetical protein